MFLWVYQLILLQYHRAPFLSRKHIQYVNVSDIYRVCNIWNLPGHVTGVLARRNVVSWMLIHWQLWFTFGDIRRQSNKPIWLIDRLLAGLLFHYSISIKLDDSLDVQRDRSCCMSPIPGMASDSMDYDPLIILKSSTVRDCVLMRRHWPVDESRCWIIVCVA